MTHRPTTRTSPHVQLKSEMTARVQLVTGAVRRVYDRQGVEITALEDFQDQGHYIACGGEKLKAESCTTTDHRARLYLSIEC